MKILALYGGSRKSGNSEQLAKLALDGIEVTSLYLNNYHIEPIDDGRHRPEGFLPVKDDYGQITRQVLDHDVLFFVTPVYWYGMSGVMKDFIDRWSQVMRDPQLDFKNKMSQKKAYVITVGGDQAKIKGLPLIQQFQYIFNFMGMTFSGYIIGQGNAPGDILRDTPAITQAELLNKELKRHIQSVGN